MQKHVYLANGMCRVTCNFLPKKGFPAILTAILKICVKCKNAYILEMVQYTIFDLQGIHRFICNILPKIFFLPLFGSHITFLHKMQKLFILVTVQDRAILAICKSVTYFWKIYHIVKLQIYSSLHT